MNILIIDDSPDFRALLRVYLSKELEGLNIEDYDIENLGKPADNFDWSAYDLLFLDYQLGEEEDGLAWLKGFRRKKNFPPTIVLTAEGDEYVAIRAIKLGAADYINKKDISPLRLKELVEDAVEFGEDRDSAQEDLINDATQIIKSIHKSKEDLPEQNLDIGYKFVRLIGQGAMSHVYLAERVLDRQSLVLKILDLTKCDDETLLKRFLLEAELIAELNSPFVVQIYEHGLTEKYGYIAMEFFSRGDLKQRMELKLTPDVAFNYMTHICYGLAAIHRIGVVHRDLKPANIMFRGDDSLALADFGISKRIENDGGLTSIGQVLGTPHYMSPEQGEALPVDSRSDIYSAGILLFELLTGEKPFTAQTPAALIYQHEHGDLPTLPDQFRQYQFIIDKTLAKNPVDRYQTAMELVYVLEEAERDYQ
ncbi:MAG: protein kinase [Gammaproteobacteria bacterium]|jgi:eukaryotic-like serine/threonine-protein kinase|nr:protein kinase [Gammaproteobacteria bacterium]